MLRYITIAIVDAMEPRRQGAPMPHVCIDMTIFVDDEDCDCAVRGNVREFRQFGQRWAEITDGPYVTRVSDGLEINTDHWPPATLEYIALTMCDEVLG